jgi:hypothetical protein
MNRTCEWLVKRISRALPPEEREAVQGDLAELGIGGGQALRELLGLVMRRQAAPWMDWRPWLSLFGLAGLVGVFLTRISFSLIRYSTYQLSFLRTYGTFFRNGLSASEEISVFTCQSLAVILWAWAAGFTLGSLSRRTVWINGAFFYLVSFSFWPVLRLRLPLARGAALDIALILVLQAVLFFLPSILGLRQGIRQDRRPLRHTRWWAAAIVAMTLLVTWMTGWRQSGLRAWSGGSWPHHLVSWETRLLPFALANWPVLYLIASANKGRWQRQTVSR